jgi:hypothetical protein
LSIGGRDGRGIEEAETKFQAENVADGVVDVLDLKLVVREQRFYVIEVGGADHFHVDAGEDGFAGGIRGIGGETVWDHFGDGGVVADDEAIEGPFFTENLTKGQEISGHGNAIEGVESGHERRDTGFARGAERREIDVAQENFGNPGAVVFAAAFRGSVSDVVLGAGGDCIGRTERTGLESANHGGRERACKIRIFAEAFGYAAPAGVASDVHHGREGPADAFGRRFFGRGSRGGLDQIGIPAGGLAQGNREDGSIAVDNVAAEQQRDAQAALFHGDALRFGAIGGASSV